ncbi:squalene/phytoene synthase family protein [Caenispirillum bisanense]|uniref:Squalene synthase HpnC n=1 Tax=Caenispirillum bisanense TaxID=414052 RepID=A0A286GEQ2_9PROT|nr:squalene/phytoene synthase family protein [Caenispirillum bisanense]SOD93997.1 squalene synthase HpnC [Caenispirillum bisanense]
MPVSDTAVSDPSPTAAPAAAPRSGKGMGDENFPVASRLLAARHRPVVVAYYRFARTADDIADAEAVAPDAKVAALDTMAAVLAGEADPRLSAEAAALRPLLLDRGIPLAVASDLLIAFRADSRGEICRTWQDLLDYCVHSANPVGRFLLRLHGAPAAADRPSDALCSALQILNHLQDMREDWLRLRRLYLPLAWIEAAGATPEDMARGPMPEPFRGPILAALDRTDALLAEARPLPGLAGDRGLAMQARMVIDLAERLSRRLRAAAPETAGVKAGRLDWAAAALAGLWAGIGGGR